MWKMFDDNDFIIECSECGGILGPPPKFMLPPPPRPPSMGSLSNCNEEEMALKTQQAWERDGDMCEAMPILDASLYSSQSLQTSAMIAVFSLLLVLVILISSLFVWKNKRKVQNFLPCKTPTRGPHINGGLPIVSAHAVTYEDPDAHLAHRRPLVMRHHHNVEVLHPKSIHYPSGYPMTRSPPFLVSSSPGPDPYRSNDNVYEELGPGRDSDGESEAPLHSDDDFAEDELSLPGERSYNKAVVTGPDSGAVANSYLERTGVAVAAGGPERHSVLSSSSSTQDASTATAASTTSSHNNNSAPLPLQSVQHSGNGSGSRNGAPAGGLFGGVLRHTTGRSKFHTTNGTRVRTERPNGVANAAAAAASLDDCLNTSTSTADTCDLTPMQQLYDQRSNLMSLAHAPHHHQHQLPPHAYNSQSLHSQRGGHHIHGHNVRATAPQFYNTLESEVERRNRINAQLRHAPAVATIFRERIHYPGSGRYPQPYYMSNANNGLMASATRARTNPRSVMDRRHRIAAPLDVVEPAYGYAEPLYQENYHYDSCSVPTAAALQKHQSQQQQARLGYPAAYIMPTNYASSTGGPQQQAFFSHNHGATTSTYQPLYARGGDSSFGSDSGYSHHTPASSIGRGNEYDVALPIASSVATPTPAAHKAPSRLAAALNFTSWNRRKGSQPPLQQTPPATLNVGRNVSKSNCNSNNASNAVSGSGSGSGSGMETTSPNNNSASSTITSTLEHSSTTSGASAGSAASAASATAQNNNNSPTTLATCSAPTSAQPAINAATT